MKRLLKILAAAAVGALVGNVIRQKVRDTDGEEGELVIAADPVAVASGVAAGLLIRRWPVPAAFLAGANVGANYPR